MSVKKRGRYCQAQSGRHARQTQSGDKKACVEDMQRAQALGRYNRIIQKNAEFIEQQDLLAVNLKTRFRTAPLQDADWKS